MKKRGLKLLALTMVGALMVGTFVGCSEQKTNDKKVGMVLSTLNNPFFVSMKEGAEKKAKEMGYELVVLDSQNDAIKERSNVEDLIQQGVSVLMINPTDSDAVKNSIQVANDNNVPVITLDRQANGAEVVSHISSDNVEGGNMAAEYMLENLKDKDVIKVVELQGVPGASATRDRGKGFNDVISGKSNVKVVSSQSAEFDRQKGLSVMENIIQATPDFDVVFAHNDEMALGAVKALKAANKDVMVIGFDGNADAEEAIKNGDMTATIAQQPVLMGEIAIQQASKILKGESVEKQVPVDLKVLKNS